MVYRTCGGAGSCGGGNVIREVNRNFKIDVSKNMVEGDIIRFGLVTYIMKNRVDYTADDLEKMSEEELEKVLYYDKKKKFSKNDFRNDVCVDAGRLQHAGS